jgi:hypothetical protein
MKAMVVRWHQFLVVSEREERGWDVKGKDIGCHLRNLRESPSCFVSNFLGVNNTLSDTRGSFRPKNTTFFRGYQDKTKILHVEVRGSQRKYHLGVISGLTERYARCKAETTNCLTDGGGSGTADWRSEMWLNTHWTTHTERGVKKERISPRRGDSRYDTWLRAGHTQSHLYLLPNDHPWVTASCFLTSYHTFDISQQRVRVLLEQHRCFWSKVKGGCFAGCLF